jgi:DNA-binding transcriptional ArsR family regulator
MPDIPTTFTALAEPNRFRIIELLRLGPRTVNAIAAELQLNQPQASKHLRHLREAGLVDAHPQAQRRHYALRPEPLRDLHEWTERYRSVWDQRFTAMDELIDELKAAQREDAPREDG